MNSNIPVKVIFSKDDKLCPEWKQLHYWNKIPNRGEYEYVKGEHGS